jgi:hypothetical protein
VIPINRYICFCCRLQCFASPPPPNAPSQEHQAQYIVSCLRFLIERYAIGPRSHQGVILVGHSFGGVVARMVRPDCAGCRFLGM